MDASKVSRGAIGLLMAIALIFGPAGSAQAYDNRYSDVNCSTTTSAASGLTVSSNYGLIVSPPEVGNDTFPYRYNSTSATYKVRYFTGARHGTWRASTGGSIVTFSSYCIR